MWPVRRLFIPAEGQWLSADAKQIEYRFFGHYSNSKSILDVYQKDPNADFHETVMLLLQRLVDIERKHTKNVNFAMVFGVTPACAASTAARAAEVVRSVKVPGAWN